MRKCINVVRMHERNGARQVRRDVHPHSCIVCILLIVWSPRAQRARRRVTGPPNGRRARWPARDIKFPPYEIQTLPNGLQVVAVLHHEQPAVSMRLLIRHRQRVGSEREARPRASAGVAARSGHHHQVGARDERRHRLHRRRDGRRCGQRSQLRQHGRDEGQLRDRPADAGRHGRASGVLRRRDRSAAPAVAVVPPRQPRRSRVPRQLGVRSARVRLQPVRDAGQRHAGDDGEHHAERSGRVSPASTSRRTTPSSRLSAT